MDISVVIPLYNEEESLPELVEWIDRVMQEHNFSHEIIMVNDGSTDTSWKVVNELKKKYDAIKAISFRRNYGKAAALHVGFTYAEGEVVITMDADLQDSPEEIPDLYKMIMEDGFDLVSGWKKERHDPITKTIPTKLYNGTTRLLTGIKLHDMNCGLKSYRKDVVKSIEVFGEMHRYIPVLAKAAGFKKIGEKVVKHQARKYGVTKYGLNRFINGFLDLISIVVITRYTKKPMHFFGAWGTFFGLIGGGTLSYLLFVKVFLNWGLGERMPLMFFGTVCFLLGITLFSTGLLAELISRASADRNRYLIGETVGLETD